MILLRYIMYHLKRFTEWNKHARNARNSASHHGREQNPSSAPSVHQIPTDKVGRNLNSTADEKALKKTRFISFKFLKSSLVFFCQKFKKFKFLESNGVK
jgi:hypothetical protein